MTHQQWPVRRIFGALAAPLLMAGLLIGSWPAAASASGCESWTGVQPLSPGTTFNALEGVTELSPCDAWAVGAEFSGTAEATLIEHWNGSGWTTVPSPNPGTVSNLLVSVRAVSQTNIWAVGSYSDSNSPGVGFLTLVLHWNGLAWKQVPSPNPGAQDNYLLGVRAVSAHDAWAVGYDSGSGGNKTLILRWNGTKWTQVPTPNPGFDNELSGVAATSSGDAWAVGSISIPGADQTLILHWNGATWKRMASPNPGTGNELFGVGATSSASAWAVGFSAGATRGESLNLHWNGRTWTRVASPNPGGASNKLWAVAAASASNAWVVRSFSDNTQALAFPLLLTEHAI